jgi:hypothetical protein
MSLLLLACSALLQALPLPCQLARWWLEAQRNSVVSMGKGVTYARSAVAHTSASTGGCVRNARSAAAHPSASTGGGVTHASGSGICEHRRVRYTCKKCGGLGICEHGRVRPTCNECGGSGIFEHRRRRDGYKKCVPQAWYCADLRCCSQTRSQESSKLSSICVHTAQTTVLRTIRKGATVAPEMSPMLQVCAASFPRSSS